MDFSLGFNLSQTNLLSAVSVPVNQQPTAYSDSATTAYQTPVEIDLITNDIDLDGSIDASSVEITTQPVNGVVTINAQNGVATYTPNDGFSGTDSFEYRVSDMEGAWSEPVAVNLLVEPLRRNFTYLEESGGMYYQLSEELLFTDFEWDFDIMPEGDGDFHQLIAGYDCTLNLRAVDDLVFFINGASNTTTTATLIRGKFNHINIKRVSGVLTMTVNGASTSTTQDNTPFSVTRIGMREDYGTTSSFTGILANFKMWNGGDSSTGTLVLDMPFSNDLEHSRFEENQAAVYTTDHANTFIAEPQWTEANGTYTYNGNGELNRLHSYAPEAEGYYVVKFTVSNLVGEGKLYQLESGFRTYTVIDSDGDYVVCVWDASGIGFTRNTPGEACSFDVSNLQLLKNPAGYPLARTYNVSPEEVSPYMFDENYSAWVGENVVTQSIWENPASLGDVGWSFANNKWTLVGDGSLSELQLMPSYDQFTDMLLTGEVESISGGNGLSVTSGSTTLPLNTAGHYDYVIHKNVDGSQQYKRRGGFVNAVLLKPAIHKFLEVV